ncbi:MAG: hypothetical protein V1918_03075 [Planctomycetota bacterium]
MKRRNHAPWPPARRGRLAGLFSLAVGIGLILSTARSAETEEEAVLPFAREEVVYLKGVLEARLKAQGLPDGERALASAILERLQADRPRPAEPVERAQVEERLKEFLRADVAAKPDAREPRLALARFYLFEDDPERALRHLDRAGPGSELDVFWPLLAAYAHLRLGEHATATRLLEGMGESIGRLIPLQIQRALFCEEVRQYGQYNPRPEKAFAPGESTWLYLEVMGPGFRAVGDQHELRLSFGLAVRNDLQQTLYDEPQYCRIFPKYRHPVRTVFAGVDFLVPDYLPSGKYTLIVTCRDETSGREVTSDLPFSIGERLPTKTGSSAPPAGGAQVAPVAAP